MRGPSGTNSGIVLRADARGKTVTETVTMPEGGGVLSLSASSGAALRVTAVLPPGDGAYRVAAELADGASLSMVVIADGVGNVRIERTVTLGKDARLEWHDWTAEGGPVAMHGEIALAGDGAAAFCRSAFFRTGGELLDGDITIRHEAPRTASRIFCDGVLDGRASASFLGRTTIGTGMAESDADQRQRIILLSDEARVRIDPVLEIATDDVHCGHGGSVGSLDGRTVFYLMSRGIPAARAKALALEGFFAPFVRAIGKESTMVTDSLTRRIDAARI